MGRVGNRKANKIVARLVPPSVFLEVAVAGILATATSWPQTAFYKSRNSILLCSRYVAIEKFVSGVKKF